MKRGIGITLIILGIVLLLNSTSNITGFVIAQNISTNISFIVGLVLVIGGMGILMAGKKNLTDIIVEDVNGRRKTTLPTIISSSRFRTTSKKAPPKELLEALRKIGTGLGKEEKLSDGNYSIRVTGRDRVIFQYDKNRSKVNLIEYSEHYKK